MMRLGMDRRSGGQPLNRTGDSTAIIVMFVLTGYQRKGSVNTQMVYGWFPYSTPWVVAYGHRRRRKEGGMGELLGPRSHWTTRDLAQLHWIPPIGLRHPRIWAINTRSERHGDDSSNAMRSVSMIVSETYRHRPHALIICFPDAAW